MTIVTKPKIEKKWEKPLGKPLVEADAECGDGECTCVVDEGSGGSSVGEVEAWVSSAARRRVSTVTTICICLTGLLVMSVGIIGGVYLYRQFSRHQMSRFHGWCGIPYIRESLGNPSMPLEGHPSMYNKGRNEVRWGQMKPLLKEHFEIDLEDESYEEIRVPDFGFGRQGHFTHDFKTNQTGIIDMTFQRCYVMPLNRTYVLPPTSLYDLVTKMWMGYYNVDTRVVRETTRVVYPRIQDYRPFGVYITKYCSTYPTFRLRRISLHEMKKRSVDGVEEEEEGIHFVEFAGKKIVHFTILDGGEEQ